MSAYTSLQQILCSSGHLNGYHVLSMYKNQFSQPTRWQPFPIIVKPEAK
jgi:hypothetical protein